MNEAACVHAFALMWEQFSEPTVLVRQDHTVVAANAQARRSGLRRGGRCFGAAPLGDGKDHGRTGTVDRSLQNHQAVSEVSLALGAPITSYWLPLPESPDLYIHFGFGVAELLRNQATGLPAQDQGQDHVS